MELGELDPKQHFTQPPPRYNEALLIHDLEEKGIGRPSTYAAIISTIQDRKYIEKQEGRFYPTELGNTVNETECLVMAGYSAMQGVMSVTIEAAKALDMDDTVGSLEPGKKADVIVVDGSPDEDILDLWKVDEVFFNGERMDRGSMKSLASTRQQRPAGGP